MMNKLITIPALIIGYATAVASPLFGGTSFRFFRGGSGRYSRSLLLSSVALVALVGTESRVPTMRR
jgi:hypothetical protein